MRAMNAVAAIINDGNGAYLMQLRDNRPDIFFPGRWGFFGGAIEDGESDGQALHRELAEELGPNFPVTSGPVFTTFTFDFNFANGGVLSRTFFELTVDADVTSLIQLNEGAAFDFIDGQTLCAQERVVPYDHFALWMHINRDRITTG